MTARGGCRIRRGTGGGRSRSSGVSVRPSAGRGAERLRRGSWSPFRYAPISVHGRSSSQTVVNGLALDSASERAFEAGVSLIPNGHKVAILAQELGSARAQTPHFSGAIPDILLPSPLTVWGRGDQEGGARSPHFAARKRATAYRKSAYNWRRGESNPLGSPHNRPSRPLEPLSPFDRGHERTIRYSNGHQRTRNSGQLRTRVRTLPRQTVAPGRPGPRAWAQDLAGMSIRLWTSRRRTPHALDTYSRGGTLLVYWGGET
jgi:hypothetical protein